MFVVSFLEVRFRYVSGVGFVFEDRVYGRGVGVLVMGFF